MERKAKGTMEKVRLPGSEEKAAREPYAPPKLTKYGRIRDLVQGASPGPQELEGTAWYT